MSIERQRRRMTHLVVNVMVIRIVSRDQLQGVERKCVAAVIIDGLAGGEREEEDGLPRAHTGRGLRND